MPILIIDDSAEDLLLAEQVIRQQGILNPIWKFQNAEDAAAFILKAPTDAAPALVLLDLVMSPVNGLQLLTSLRANRLLSRSLVVLLAGLSDVRHIQKGYDAGASTFLIKPFSRDDFSNFLVAFGKRFRVEPNARGQCLFWAEQQSALPLRAPAATSRAEKPHRSGRSRAFSND